MAREFVISDTHFSHRNILTFKKMGSPIRDFSNAEDMNMYMVERWNSVVGEGDTVIHLGDVVFAQDGFEYLSMLNGKKILVMGNHERHRLEQYTEHFDKIKAYWEIGDVLFSHIPVHPRELSRWSANCHGHLHTEQVMLEDGEIDPRYLCVSVEQWNYTPVPIETVMEIFRERGVLC